MAGTDTNNPVLAEREACAQIAERSMRDDYDYATRYPDEARKMEERAHRAGTIAAAIRARPAPESTAPFIVHKNDAAGFIEIVTEDVPTFTRLVDGFPSLQELWSLDRTRVVGYRIYGRQEPAPAPADYAELCGRLRARQSEYVEGQIVAPADYEALEAADAIEALSAQLADARARALEEAAKVEVVRHKKRQTEYEIVGPGLLQSDTPLSDMAPLVIYRCRKSGELWARAESEFHDGRFEIKKPLNLSMTREQCEAYAKAEERAGDPDCSAGLLNDPAIRALAEEKKA